MTFKLNGQTLPKPSYPITDPSTTDDIDPVEYVKVSDDEECSNVLIPGDVQSLLKKVTNGPTTIQLDNSPDNDFEVDNNPDATDSEDVPDWGFDPEEKQSPNSTYEFCPAPHHKQLLSIITQHFCHHHFFPTCLGLHQSPAEIHEQCIHEMYLFCKWWGLAEVWAYMWNSWYSPSMWDLWAWSSRSNILSWLCTTMTAESHWWHLKHTYLSFMHWPHLDQMVYTMIHDVIPEEVIKVQDLDGKHLIGRPAKLTTFQEAAKKA